MRQSANGRVTGDPTKEASGNIDGPGGFNEMPNFKKTKISDQKSPSSRPTKGGKSIPRKAPPVSTVPMTASASPKPKNGGKKQGLALATKAPPAPQGKYKSAEVIEDSDEDYGLDASGDEEVNEFAKMVDESLAADVRVDGRADDDEDDDSDEDETGEDEDEANELGGARLVVRDEGRTMTGEFF